MPIDSQQKSVSQGAQIPRPSDACCLQGQPMSGSVVLLHLAGAVALMLFATRMVRTGVERAYGDVLRHRLRATMRNLFWQCWPALVLSIALQSSTAVTLLVGSFAGAGIVSGMAGPACRARRRDRFGAGGEAAVASTSTLLVPIAWSPGPTMFMATERRNWRQVRPHPRRHRPARAVAANDRPGIGAAARKANCCR